MELLSYFSVLMSGLSILENYLTTITIIIYNFWLWYVLQFSPVSNKDGSLTPLKKFSDKPCIKYNSFNKSKVGQESENWLLLAKYYFKLIRPEIISNYQKLTTSPIQMNVYWVPKDWRNSFKLDKTHNLFITQWYSTNFSRDQNVKVYNLYKNFNKNYIKLLKINSPLLSNFKLNPTSYSNINFILNKMNTFDSSFNTIKTLKKKIAPSLTLTNYLPTTKVRANTSLKYSNLNLINFNKIFLLTRKSSKNYNNFFKK